MRIAYVGNIHDHGTSLSTFGTAVVFLLGNVEKIDCLDIYCPKGKNNFFSLGFPDKINIHEYYDESKPWTILNILKIDFTTYDLVIFNMLPTSFGISNFVNIIGLLAPYILYKFKSVNVKLIFHNSTYTNNVKKLGYSSKLDSLKIFFLSRVEKLLFTTVPTYFPLQLYVKKLKTIIPNSKVKFLDAKYYEGLSTFYLNAHNGNNTFSNHNHNSEIKKILLHGHWGPQKNLELALSSLKKLRENGVKFFLTLSGKINVNFPSYSLLYTKIIDNYEEIIDEKTGYVEEKDMLALILRNDIVLMPYSASGGHSGVLSLAMTFEKTVVSILHEEFLEQAEHYSNILFCSEYTFLSTLQEAISKVGSESDVKTNIHDKILHAQNSLLKIIE